METQLRPRLKVTRFCGFIPGRPANMFSVFCPLRSGISCPQKLGSNDPEKDEPGSIDVVFETSVSDWDPAFTVHENS